MAYKATKWQLSTAILSMSLLTVMAGAAIAPALGIIGAHFAGTNPMVIQMLISVPALFIILTNLYFPSLCRRYSTRTLVLSSLALYILAGAGAFLLNDIWIIMILRALLGISVGIMMPLSTGLLVHYFSPDKQAHLMGLSSSMNYLGGVIATLLAGALAEIGWQWSFLVYLMGLIAWFLCLLYVPHDRLPSTKGSAFTPKNLRRFSPYLAAMLLVMPIFFIYPTNYALVAAREGVVASWAVAPIMSLLDIVAFVMGIWFHAIFQRWKTATAFLPPVAYLLGYAVLLLDPGYTAAIAGSVIIGIGCGIGIPLIFASAARAAGPTATTTVFPLLSAALYCGQFLTPLVVSWGGRCCVWSDNKAYWVAITLSLVLLLFEWRRSR